MSEKKCIFKKLPSADKWFFEELVRYTETDKVGKVPDDIIIVGTFELALTGDEKAIDFFSKRPKSLVLDGGAALEYKETSSLIARLKKAGCLK